jgi:hypothetical protein
MQSHILHSECLLKMGSDVATCHIVHFYSSFKTPSFRPLTISTTRHEKVTIYIHFGHMALTHLERHASMFLTTKSRFLLAKVEFSNEKGMMHARLKRGNSIQKENANPP